MRRLWLDDMRPAPEGYDWVENYDQAVRYWETNGTPDIASLDHDLWGFSPYYAGVREYNGADFVQWLCGDDDRWPHIELSIHTDFTGGRENMARLIEDHGPYEYRTTYDRVYEIPEKYGYKPDYYTMPGSVRVYGYTYTKEPAYVS